MIASRLFTWLQGADFYHALHEEAVALLPLAKGTEHWIDVGCGPGLVTRLAALKGYQALGIDIDAQMIATARRIGQQEGSTATFRVGTSNDIASASATVVSVASLLAVLPDPLHELITLWDGVCPRGTLLIIEPTANMTVAHARNLLAQGVAGKRRYALYLWARARQGRAIDPSLFERLEAQRRDYVPLLHGLVGAWLIHK